MYLPDFIFDKKKAAKQSDATEPLSGNVAEILIGKEVRGGSYLHPLEKCKIDELIEQDADERTSWLGFRCMMF